MPATAPAGADGTLHDDHHRWRNPVTDLRRLVDEPFVAWSSGDPDAVERHLLLDALLWDSVNGAFRGHSEIRALHVTSLERWDDLTCHATRYWPPDDDSIAITWTMSGSVADDRFGTELRGASATFDGMSYITFLDGLVAEEIEYFDRFAALLDGARGRD